MNTFNKLILIVAQPNKKDNQSLNQESETGDVVEAIPENSTDNQKSMLTDTGSVIPTNFGLRSETAPCALGIINGIDDQYGQPEAINKKALSVINRVRDKLTGRDFNPNEKLAVPQQVDLLIKQATSKENLCQCYIGWCPFW